MITTSKPEERRIQGEDDKYIIARGKISIKRMMLARNKTIVTLARMDEENKEDVVDMDNIDTADKTRTSGDCDDYNRK